MKDSFPFAAAKYVPDRMLKFEKEYLSKFTPCHFSTLNKIIEAITIVHTELILIHPFREGNGRLGRLIAIIMGTQAGFFILNFDNIKNKIISRPYRQELTIIIRL